MSSLIDNIDLSSRSSKIKLTIVFGIFISLIILLSFFVRNTSRDNADEYFDPYGPAILLNSEELYKEVTDSYVISQLRNDLTLYARKTIKKYSEESIKVVFKIDDINSNDQQIQINGKYDFVNESIEITLIPKNYSRVGLSMTNKSSGVNIDNELVSNNDRNTFISRLPLDDKNYNYSIEFDVLKDTFSIKLYDVTKGEEAVDLIINSTGTSLEEENISLVPLGENNYLRFEPVDPAYNPDKDLGD